MAFSLALVDFDGTLADSMPYWLRLPADTLRAAGLPQPEGFAEYIRSVPIREIARDMGAKYPQLEAETPLAVRWSAEMAAHYAREIPLKPGAKKLLQTLRAAGLRVYILSATRRALLDPAIERLGVAPAVKAVDGLGVAVGVGQIRLDVIDRRAAHQIRTRHIQDRAVLRVEVGLYQPHARKPQRVRPEGRARGKDAHAGVAAQTRRTHGRRPAVAARLGKFPDQP